MTQILVCKNSNRRTYFQTGISLVEILVSLAILSLIAVISVPSTGRVLESFEFRSKVDIVKRDVRLLRARAMLEKRNLVYPSYQNNVLVLPEDFSSAGWTISGNEITFLKTGICLGGSLLITSPAGRQQTLDFAAPTCDAGE